MKRFLSVVVALMIMCFRICGMDIENTFNTKNCSDHNRAYRFDNIECEAQAYLRTTFEKDMYGTMSNCDDNQISQKFKNYYKVIGDNDFQHKVNNSINEMLKTKISQELVKVIICKLETRAEFVNCLDAICESIQQSINDNDESLGYKLCLFANNFL